jgi:hypothetical protein
VPPLKLDSLNDLGDDELQAVIDRSNELLKDRDRQRKDKALEQARAILTGAGLTLKDVANGKQNSSGKAVYHSGHQYAHPTNKALVYSGVGKKPGWLRQLELQGVKPVNVPVEAANDNIPLVRKTG